ncbi:MAG: conjugal transfer protein TraX [Lachnospiraceae bacterium]|nr:conjugal transfer protein TraX [Lachnospiraceae bacterium]
MNKIEYLLERKVKIKLDGGALRIIATASMLIDHIALMLIGNGILYGYRPDIHEVALSTPVGKKWYILYVIMRSIGRLAFPMFCFLLVEGFIHTKNLFKYFFRLVVLAIISEIPFNLVCGNSLLYFERQNTIFTFVLSLFMLYIVKKVDAIRDERIQNVIKIIIVAIVCWVSYALHLDYSISGIILIFCIYFFRHDKNLRMASVFIISFLISFVEPFTSFRYFGVGALSALILFLYNDKVGYLYRYRWMYYLLYPLHLIILYGVVFFTYIKI